jgi:hypothetical protein
MIAKLFNSFKKSPLLAFIKFEPTFLTDSLAVCLSAPVPAFTQEFRSGRQGEAGGRGVWGEFRPPSPASSVRIFSNRHRQLGNEVIGSPATRARQPFFGEISSRFEFSKAKSGLF